MCSKQRLAEEVRAAVICEIGAATGREAVGGRVEANLTRPVLWELANAEVHGQGPRPGEGSFRSVNSPDSAGVFQPWMRNSVGNDPGQCLAPE